MVRAFYFAILFKVQQFVSFKHYKLNLCQEDWISTTRRCMGVINLALEDSGLSCWTVTMTLFFLEHIPVLPMKLYYWFIHQRSSSFHPQCNSRESTNNIQICMYTCCFVTSFLMQHQYKSNKSMLSQAQISLFHFRLFIYSSSIR